MLSTIKVFALCLATLCFVQRAWSTPPHILNGHSLAVRNVKEDKLQLPQSPLFPKSPSQNKPQEGNRTPPVIDPPTIDPEIAIPPPITDPEIVVTPESIKPTQNDRTTGEISDGLGSDIK